MRIAVFASGSGSNFQALVEGLKDYPEAEFILLFSDNPQAYALERAKKIGIKSICRQVQDFSDRQAYEEFLGQLIDAYQIDLLLLAGYMRVVGQALLRILPNRILNIHPSLLPQFPGRQGIQDAYDAGVVQTGVTVHLVDEGIDTGPILAQENVMIDTKDSLADLEYKIHQVEHRLYPTVVKEFIEGVSTSD